MGYQTRDLIEAVRGDGVEAASLRVDGGMAGSDWTMQFVADLLDLPVDRPVDLETTARGAAWLAGFHAGFYPGAEEWAARWERGRRFTPAMDAEVRERKLGGWHDAVRRTLSAPLGRRAAARRTAGRRRGRLRCRPPASPRSPSTR